MIGFEDKKYPSVMVQGVLLATNLLYLQHAGPNINILISVGLVVTLFSTQALNPRFFYYFPLNGFTGKTTYHVDTYVLYGLTFLAFFFMIAGFLLSFWKAFISTIAILLFAGLWAIPGRKMIRHSLTKKLSGETHVFKGKCPCCDGELVIERNVLDWNEGIENWKCNGKCGLEKEVKRDDIVVG